MDYYSVPETEPQDVEVLRQRAVVASHDLKAAMDAYHDAQRSVALRQVTNLLKESLPAKAIINWRSGPRRVYIENVEAPNRYDKNCTLTYREKLKGKGYTKGIHRCGFDPSQPNAWLRPDAIEEEKK